MKAIHFVEKNAHEHQFVKVLKQEVRDYFDSKNLSVKGDVSMYFKTFVMLLLYLSPFVLLVTMEMHVVLAIVLLVVMGIGMAGTGMSVMHDAVHGSYSSKKWVNSLMSASIYLLGSSKETWMTQHNYLHHSYTNITGYDEDIETKGLVRLSAHAPWRRYHKWQHIYAFLFYGFMTLAKFVGDFTQLTSYRNRHLPHAVKGNLAYELLRITTTKLIYLAVAIGLPILATDYTWWQVLIGFSIVHLTGGMIMSTVFQMAHVVDGTDQPMPDSAGLIHNEWMVHQLDTTSDFARTNRVLGWYIGGLNFQIEHHLFPNICHVHYRRIAPIVQRTAREFGITYNIKPTFTDALRSHLRTLKRLGRKPEVRPVLNGKNYEGFAA